MPTFQTLVAFAVVSAGIMLVPGPSNLFLLAHGIGHGRRSALVATSGIQLASAIRVLLTAAGLSALLASSAAAFNAVRWAGVAYLIYLGIRSLVSGQAVPTTGEPTHHESLATSARRGLIVGLGNPKMVIFYISFFPQFIHPAQGSQTAQILVLGAVFWIIGAIWDALFACAAGTIGTWLQHRPRARVALPQLEGITYLGLAGWAALSDTR